MRFLMVLCAALMLSAPAKADAGAIQGVISSQIEAFKADDFETAFTYASPSIRSIFGGPDRFGLMVREGYPMVWRPAAVEFVGLAEKSGRLAQQVLITDSFGRLHLLEYYMEQGPEGWRIGGVQLLEANAFGA